MPNLRRRAAASFALLAPLAVLDPAQAQTTGQSPPGPLSMDRLVDMLTNLGYEPKVQPTGKFVDFSGTYNFHARLSAPGDEVLTYVFLQFLTDEQLAKLDMKALLMANDVGPSFFSIARVEDKWALYLQRAMPSAGVTPVNMRATVENLTKVTAANESVWNPAKWKSG